MKKFRALFEDTKVLGDTHTILQAHGFGSHGFEKGDGYFHRDGRGTDDYHKDLRDAGWEEKHKSAVRFNPDDVWDPDNDITKTTTVYEHPNHSRQMTVIKSEAGDNDEDGHDWHEITFNKTKRPADDHSGWTPPKRKNLH